jgi:two-component system sensor histidine kinase DesK
MWARQLLARLRKWLPPGPEQMPLWALLYLGFLFMPLGWQAPHVRWLGPTVLSIPVFVYLYLGFYRRGQTLARVIGIALIGFALLPVNAYASTYMVYTTSLAPFLFPRLSRALLLTCLVLALHAAQCLLLGIPLYVAGMITLLGVAACVANYFFLETMRKSEALKLSQDEIRHLATAAERERIGRDLHDLLGHTLSLIAIKSELAERLVSRDAQAAGREIAEVKSIAREALKEVRVAVSGIRAAALEGEIAAARALLESSGVELTASQVDSAMPPDVENGVAMIVREAVTNIHRHSGARHAAIEIRNESHSVILVVRDDGRGGVIRRGNGLTGIGERVSSLSGTLDIQSSPGKGTVVSARLPLPARA